MRFARILDSFAFETEENKLRNSATMLLPIELGIVIALFAGGCWSGRVAVVFLPVIAVSLILFAILFGNPMGLLVSVGGWLILDTMLLTAVLLANIAVLLATIRRKPREGSAR